MKRLQKLINATEYFNGFRLDGAACSVVVDRDNAVSVLANASGDQLLISLPEESESGDSTDAYSARVSAVIFAVARINGPARTSELARETYSRLLALAQAAVVKLSDDITGGGCGLMAGFKLTGLNVVPEYSVFGGWSGYSIELTLD